MQYDEIQYVPEDQDPSLTIETRASTGPCLRALRRFVETSMTPALVFMVRGEPKAHDELLRKWPSCCEGVRGQPGFSWFAGGPKAHD